MSPSWTQLPIRQPRYAYGAHCKDGTDCPATAAGLDPGMTFAETYDDRVRLQSLEVLDSCGTVPDETARVAWMQALGIHLRKRDFEPFVAENHLWVAVALGWLTPFQADRVWARMQREWA